MRYNEHERKRLSRNKRERKVGAAVDRSTKSQREILLDAFSLL